MSMRVYEGGIYPRVCPQNTSAESLARPPLPAREAFSLPETKLIVNSFSFKVLILSEFWIAFQKGKVVPGQQYLWSLRPVSRLPQLDWPLLSPGEHLFSKHLMNWLRLKLIKRWDNYLAHLQLHSFLSFHRFWKLRGTVPKLHNC